MNFDNFVQRFDSGEVTEAVIDELLLIVYPTDDQARSQRRERVVTATGLVKFQAVALNKQAFVASQEARLEASRAPVIESLPDLPPEFNKDVPDDVYDYPDYVPEIKSRVGIIQAVRTWGKQQAQIKDNRTEGVKVRCPYSHHTDNRPSAWVNTGKNAWFCGKCSVGGDVIDFYAAAKYDLQPNDFHRSKQFGEIVQEMADELGIRIVSTPDGGFTVETTTDHWASDIPEKDDSDESPLPSAGPSEFTEQTDQGPVTYEEFSKPLVPASQEASEPITITDDELTRGLQLDDSVEDDDFFDTEEIPAYDWRDLGLKPQTFLHSWMIQAEKELDWVPPEFFLALGLQAIGMACSHKTTSMSFGLPLTGSTLAVIVGDTAGGKSTATNRLAELLERAVGVQWDSLTGNGIKKITSTSSAEALTQRMRTEIYDPNDPENPLEVPTNAWYVEDELAVFISRSRRSGGEHIKQRVMRFHDFAKRRDEPEMSAEDHSLTGGYRNVHDSFFTGTFLTQNESLRSLATRNDLVSGFFNRMIFFMGESRAPRQFTNVVAQDPTPPYVALYERMWKDCTNKKRVIPFSDAAGRLIDSHPLNDRLNTISALSGMFSRWQHNMLRISFLLAVNENSPLIEVEHVNAAYHLISSYLIPCAGVTVGLVKKSDTTPGDELVHQIEDSVAKRFDEVGEWPSKRWVQQRKWYRQADTKERNRAIALAVDGGDPLVEVTLVDGPWGSHPVKFIVVPSGDFSSFHGMTGKTFKYKDFYVGRSKR